MTYSELLSHVAERSGLASPQQAERTVRAVLGVIRERLSWPTLQALAEDLPAPLAASLRVAGTPEEFDLVELYARVARREGVRPGFALEHTGIVCQVIAEALTPAALYRLREALPEEIAALFQPREQAERFEPVHAAPRRRTLAEGRPGSQHPLYEARAERAHTHSVVRADNPHADTKLSSATGLTQEREQETLATGHPK